MSELVQEAQRRPVPHSDTEIRAFIQNGSIHRESLLSPCLHFRMLHFARTHTYDRAYYPRNESRNGSKTKEAADNSKINGFFYTPAPTPLPRFIRSRLPTPPLAPSLVLFPPRSA
jgi:hypothetical protein